MAITLLLFWTPARSSRPPMPRQAAASPALPAAGGPQQPAQQKPAALAMPPAAPSAPANQAKPASSPGSFATVVIDPAHGGPDAGARGASGAVESEVVLSFALALRAALEAQGLRVVLTREGNQDPSFDDRSALVNGLRNCIFLSLHVSSTGPLGTARAYFLRAPGGPILALAQDLPASPRPASSRVGLVRWDRAQIPYLPASQQLAELIQIQLAQKFNGSPEVPADAAIFQLRSIAAPAVALEVSSVAVAEPQRLTQMAQPLADAVARAVADFRAAGGTPPTPRGGP